MKKGKLLRQRADQSLLTVIGRVHGGKATDVWNEKSSPLHIKLCEEVENDSNKGQPVALNSFNVKKALKSFLIKEY